MKALTLTLLAILLSPIATAQTPAPTPGPSEVYAFGIAYNGADTHPVAGMALFAKSLNDRGTYGFTEFDAVPTSTHPITVQNDVAVGVAQKAFSIGKVDIYAAADAGFAWKGSNMGWEWKPGFLASIKLYDNWRAYPNVRFRGSSISDGSGVQPIFGVMFGYAKTK